MSDKEKKICRTLQHLAKIWPRHLQLFANAGGSIQILRVKNFTPQKAGDHLKCYELIADISGIRCDGGDPGTWEDAEDFQIF